MSEPKLTALPQADSTNLYCKAHLSQMGHFDAVWTTCQTAGRGRRGHVWQNAPGEALYYTILFKEPLADPACLSLASGLAAARALEECFGAECALKWPNDLLLGGKKIAGILCEAVSYGTGGEGRAYLCGIGINLAQPQSYFDEAGLPYGTSLALQGAKVDLDADPSWLAEGLTDFGFDRALYTFGPEGFAPYRDAYTAACVNLGRRVTFTQPGGAGEGTAAGIDGEGRLIVRTPSGEEHVFTGEVSVSGIYGHV